MAGAGFKTFNTGDVLTASDVNTYLMQQTTMVFADASARSTALGANVAEGMISYLKDTKQVEVYNGTSWVASDDPNAIQNTIVDAKGDIITATGADTPARLAVGTNGQQLYADSSASTGIKWADAAGWTLLSTTTLSGATTTISSINQNYKNLRMIIYNVGNNTADGKFSIKFNGLSTGQAVSWFENGTSYLANDTFFQTNSNVKRDAVNNILFDISIGNYASTTIVGKPIGGSLYYTQTSTGTWIVGLIGGSWQSASAGISSLTFANSGGTFSSGTVLLYGGN